MVEIKIYSEPITLGQFLKFLGLIYSGGECKTFLFEKDILFKTINYWSWANQTTHREY